MKIVFIRDLRTSFPKVEALLHAGEDVWISKRGKPFARLALDTPPPVAQPDFKARFGPSATVRRIKRPSDKSKIRKIRLIRGAKNLRVFGHSGFPTGGDELT